MKFIRHKYTIGISAIIILIIVSIHGSIKTPGEQPTKTKKYITKETSIDKKTGLPTFIQKIIMPR
jgi:hypothetical protein